MPNLNEQDRAEQLRAEFESLVPRYAFLGYNETAECYINDSVDSMWRGFQLAARRQHGSAAQAVASSWVLEKTAVGAQPAYWDGGSSVSFVTDIEKCVHFCRKEDAFWATRGWRGQDTKLTEHVMIAAPPVADAEACPTCNGSRVVDDGEIDCYPNGEPFMCGPVKCVKDCPDCAALSRRPAAAPEATGGNGAAEPRDRCDKCGLYCEPGNCVYEPAAEPELLPDGREQFEVYATNLGLRDFEISCDDASDYHNPFTQGHWNYWRASREAARAHLRAAGQGSKDAERLKFTEAQICAAGRALADRSAAACNVDKDDNWKIYGDDFIADARAAIDAAKAKGEQQ